jgi:large subunit ribosomal protein L2
MIFLFLFRSKAVRFLSFGVKFSGGRTFGRIGSNHRKGFKTRVMYKIVDYYRFAVGKSFSVRFEYDSFRNRYLLLLFTSNFGFSYVLPIRGILLHSRISDFPHQDVNLGSKVSLSSLSFGNVISCIASFENGYQKFSRSPLTKSIIVTSGDVISRFIKCKLPSGVVKKFPKFATCIIGSLESKFVQTQKSSKAGFYANRGFKPIVRGVAKNPVDHPHGGGEGKKSNPAAPKSPWGWLTKYRKTSR